MWLLAELVLGMAAFWAVCLFWPAGTVAWQRGWLLVGFLMAATLVAGGVVWRVNPEVVAARSRRHAGTKRWDKVLLVVFFATMPAIFVVGALDDGRFHWSEAPSWVCGLGYVLMALGFALVSWAERVNKFFEPTVRIQTDRGHRVIDSGPYAIVRHPGYVGGSLLFGGIAPALGSYWALIPAACLCALLVLRTRLEERTLRAELPGYQEYAARVRYRWIPGVW